MRIVIAGVKCSGKSTLARELGKLLEIPSIETDGLIEDIFQKDTGERLTCREIWREHGEGEFRRYEALAVEEASGCHWCVLSLGGSTFLNPDHRRMLYADSVFVWMSPPVDVMWERIRRTGMPPFLEDSPEGKEKFMRRCELAAEVLAPLAHIRCDDAVPGPEDLAAAVAERIGEELHYRMHSPNSLGEVIRVHTFGESHGPVMGVVMDGLRPGIEIDEEYIRRELSRRRPGQSKITTSRSEADELRIVSGVFEGKTTGTPLAMIVENRDVDSSKYEALRDVFRPGHADFTFWKKYGIRDHRGGGRSSGRETVSRVAAGAIARSLMEDRGVEILGWAEEIAGIRAEAVDLDAIEGNAVRCPDPEAAKRMEQAIKDARENGDSVGGVIRLRITGLPPGLGDPVFGKLDARLSGALMSLGAVKGIEFGAGFDAARKRGSENNDPISADGFDSNNAGGVLGGISTGQPLEIRLAVKPTPSVSRKQRTITRDGEERTIEIEGRHDPCIVPRLVPVVESMAALVLQDMWEIQERLRGIDKGSE
jgi:chorismate synthase